MSESTTQPPHDLDAEKSVLGSCLCDTRVIDDVALVIRGEMFYGEQNRLIWNAIAAMQNQNKSIDTVTVAHHLSEQGTLGDVGGPAYLVDVLNTVPHAAHWDTYSEIVKGHWLRRQGIHAANLMHRAMRDPTESADQAMASVEKIMSDLIEGRGEGERCEDISSILFSVFDHLGEEREAGLLSGISQFDELTDGFRGNELIILAARPSVGKTALALNFVRNWCRNDNSVLLISAEQSKMEIVERLLSLQMNVSMHDLRDRKTDPHDESMCAGQLSEWKLFISDQASPSILSIESQARLFKRRHDLKAIVVDYLQLVTPADVRQPREQQVATISKQFKAIAKSLNIPVLVLAQLNRDVESRGGEGLNKGRPRMSDLRESGSIEQDADKVLLMWRPFKDDPDHEDHTLTMVDVAKNRNGPVGTIKLGFNAKSFHFGAHFSRSEMEPAYTSARWTDDDF